MPPPPSIICDLHNIFSVPPPSFFRYCFHQPPPPSSAIGTATIDHLLSSQHFIIKPTIRYEEDPFSAKLHYPILIYFHGYPEPLICAAFRRKQQEAWVATLNHVAGVASTRYEELHKIQSPDFDDHHVFRGSDTGMLGGTNPFLQQRASIA